PTGPVTWRPARPAGRPPGRAAARGTRQHRKSSAGRRSTTGPGRGPVGPASGSGCRGHRAPTADTRVSRPSPSPAAASTPPAAWARRARSRPSERRRRRAGPVCGAALGPGSAQRLDGVEHRYRLRGPCGVRREPGQGGTGYVVAAVQTCEGLQERGSGGERGQRVVTVLARRVAQKGECLTLRLGPDPRPVQHRRGPGGRRTARPAQGEADVVSTPGRGVEGI